MDPYKVLGISADASQQEIKRAYLSMADKYHPDHGGDAWVFEQIRTAYEQLSQSKNVSPPTPKTPSPTARATTGRATTADLSKRGHFLLRQLPLQTETSWFILINVLDLVFTNILLQRNAIEANPLANMVFVYYGFVGMIVFKLASVLFVCLAAQIIATKSPTKAKWLLWFGCAVVGAVLVYSARLIQYSSS
jgi:hypothetical protein